MIFWPDTQIIKASKWLKAPLSSPADLEAERRFQTSCFYSSEDFKFKKSGEETHSDNKVEMVRGQFATKTKQIFNLKAPLLQ